MGKGPESLGQLLKTAGVLNESEVQDTVQQQRGHFPFASMAYVLGHADEDSLVRILSKQVGIPGIVLDRSTLDLNIVRKVGEDVALREAILPFFEDSKRIFVAVEASEQLNPVIRQLAFLGGKTLVPHVALRITLARTIRRAFSLVKDGQRWLPGTLGRTDDQSSIVLVGLPDSKPEETDAHQALHHEVTSNIKPEQLLGIDESNSDEEKAVVHETFDSVEAEATTLLRRRGPKRVMVVDDDLASRHLLVKVLQPEGYATITASTGGEAIRQIKTSEPDAIIMDVMLPELDGFQVCRAIKKSQRYRHIPVVLMSAVIDRGTVTDEVLRKYGADAYLEKPVQIKDALTCLADVLKKSKSPSQERKRSVDFSQAMVLYKKGDVDGAIALLRKAVVREPLSAKQHFVLANLLQKKSLIFEAIDEYEATVEIRPDYFPALTRLAYLYYQKGFTLKAIETWRRSLKHCDDPAMTAHIGDFMRKLVSEMGKS